jgi:hypothetical protein
LNIYNSLGQLIVTERYNTHTFKDNEIDINTTRMNNGLYFIEIITGAKQASSRLIVENN